MKRRHTAPQQQQRRQESCQYFAEQPKPVEEVSEEVAELRSQVAALAERLAAVEHALRALIAERSGATGAAETYTYIG